MSDRTALPLALAALLLLAFALRAPLLLRDRFHADEALFASFARAAAVEGRWLLPGDLDKPPLAIYAMAGAIALVGAQPGPRGVLEIGPRALEFSARLPSLFASLIAAAALADAARRLAGRRSAAVGAALVVALSPLAIAYGASAFTDPVMLAAGALAVRAAVRGRGLMAGLWLGAAVAAKPQGAAFIPLALLLTQATGRAAWPAWLRMAGGLAAVGVALLAWDAARAAPTALLALAAANNEVSRFIRADEVLPRLGHWAIFLAAAAGPVGVPLWAASGLAPRLGGWANVALWLFIIGYGAAHWLIAFNRYDRYALPLLIPLALLSGWQMARWAQTPLRGWRLAALVGGLALALAAQLSLTPQVEHPLHVGPPNEDNSGIDLAAQWLDQQAVAAVVYAPWHGWLLRAYLSPWSDKRVVYYPTPRALAQGAAELAENGPRYLLARRGDPLTLWRAALAEAGFSVAPVRTFGAFSINIVQPP